ncbi:energy-coupling factor transporter transmembrane component T family protein [Celeribacter neptunius]|uniref:Biotin transport system permease protein n=1 Tax=Celeribacter neptunius TaxID=588602 RepID=A0A1I3WEE1_9RHOB|nr:energy-coupling factor transporter transmembrane protein EcfT [Celeribacter neptunius]SFK05563.1 biotin transport system permease protein [Celeribacter neptunius]
MLSDLYIPGASALHRMRPAWKLALLFLYCTALFVVSHSLMLGLGLLLIALGYGIAGLRPRHAFDAVRPALYVLVIIFAAQLWLEDLAMAAFVTLRLIALLMAAALVTYTTKASEFTDGILALLSRAPKWLPKDKIALAISLVWRFIPMIRDQFEEVREAQRARGIERSLLALVAPLVVRVLKSADEIAEAIEARSLD